MQYVFNPRNRQINPVTPSTFNDPTLREKVVSAELYALVCKKKVSLDDIAALFAVNKSPEILLKNHKAVKESPMATAPAATAKVAEAPEVKADGASDAGAPATADGAFDGRELSTKTQAELLILAGMAGVDVNAEGFAPTRQNLMKAIRARAEAAEAAKTAGAPADAAPTATTAGKPE